MAISLNLGRLGLERPGWRRGGVGGRCDAGGGVSEVFFAL